jgi:hypothetical protein
MAFSKKNKTSCITCVTILAVLMLIPVGIALHGWFVREQYMRPYNHLVEVKATKQQVIAQLGKYYEIREHKYRRLGEKALMYYADPFHDGEGFAVFIYFDKQGKVNEAFLGYAGNSK